MTALSESKTLTGSLTREALAAHPEGVKHLPAGGLDRKRAAYERFASLPMPRRTDEGWRFSNLSGLSLEGYNLPSQVSFEKLEHGDIGVSGAGTLVLANHRLAMQEPLAGEAARSGVI